MPNSLLQTPLSEWHKAHGAKTAEFAGWEMPIQYSNGIIAEHLHTRKYAGVFDICHMGEFIIEGSGITEALGKALCINFATLKPGRCRYGFLLNNQGGIIDDLVAYRLEEEKYLIVVNAACIKIDRETIQERIGSAFTVQDISATTAKIDIQGPEAVNIMESILPGEWRIPYFSLKEKTFDGVPLLVSRTGYTGELGFELYVSTQKALQLWELCLSDDRVQPVGLGARDTLRLEVGLPLNGQDIDETRTPFELGYGGMITSEADYVGKKGVSAVKDKLVALSIPGRRSARHYDKVLTTQGEEVGVITSGSYSPCLEHAIAFAYIRADKAEAEKYIIQTSKAQLEANVTTAPFYTKGTARTKLS